MATKKAAPKKQEGKSLQSWEEALKARSAISRATAQSTGGTSKSIGTQGGTFWIDKEDVGTELNVVILDSILDHAYYKDKFDPDNPSSPICFALGRIEKELVPHPDSVEPQAADCASCPWNKFGSADNGKGKANKNTVRMMVIDESDLDDIAAAEPRMLKVPVTSVKHWAGYVKNLADLRDADPIVVVTTLTLKKHPKFQFEMQFKQKRDIDGDLIGELIEKSDGIQSDLFQPYKQFEDNDEAPTGKCAGKAVAKGAPARKGAAKPRGR